MLTMKLFIMILIFNWIMPHMTVILLSLLPLFQMRRVLLMWRVEKNSMLVDHERNALCDGCTVKFIHDATENYYEGGIYACRNLNNIKFPLYVLKVSKLCLFYLPMQVDSCSHKLFAHKIPMHRKWVSLKCAFHVIHGALFHVSILYFYASTIEIFMPS